MWTNIDFTSQKPNHNSCVLLLFLLLLLSPRRLLHSLEAPCLLLLPIPISKTPPSLRILRDSPPIIIYPLVPILPLQFNSLLPFLYHIFSSSQTYLPSEDLALPTAPTIKNTSHSKPTEDCPRSPHDNISTRQSPTHLSCHNRLRT